MSACASTNPRRRCRDASRRRGLTLVEVLATIVMMAIVLPAAMQGISLCMATSVAARQRSEAAALAESKLAELVATGDWQFGGQSGDFGEAWPDYHWTAAAADWTEDPTMKQLDIRVTWTSRREEKEVVLTTLIYNSEQASQTGSTF